MKLYVSPTVELLDFYVEGVMCKSGIIVDTEHDGFIGDFTDPDDLWQ